MLSGVLLAGAAAVGATQQQTPPTFRSGVDLVTVEVSVLDRDGRPVPDLKAEDFEIKLDGRVQPVRISTFVRMGAVVETTPVASTSSASSSSSSATQNALTTERAPTAETRVFVFLVDDLSFSALRGRPLFLAAQKFVRGLPARDLVGFTTSSGSTTVNPTTDRVKVLDALGKSVGMSTDPRTARPSQMAGGQDGGTPDSPVGMMQALAIDRGDIGTLRDVIAMECFGGDREAVLTQDLSALAGSNNCVAAIQREAIRTAALTKANASRQAEAFASVIDALRDVPGFKQLVILSDGVAVGAEVGPLKPVAIAAAKAGVRISMLVEEPDLSLTDEGRRMGEGRQQTDIGMAKRRREDGQLLLDGARTVTEMAGGHMYRVIGDPDPLFERVALASSAVYRLGVDVLAGTTPGRQFEVAAKVRTRSGLTVSASRIAIAEAPEAPVVAAPVSIDERLRSTIGAGRTHDAIPMRVGTAIRRAPNAAAGVSPLELIVNVEIPASAKGPLSSMYGLVDAAGRLTSGRRELPEPTEGQPFLVSMALPISPGASKLRFAVADSEGKLGAVEVPVNGDLRVMGPFVASDLLVAAVDDKGTGQMMTLDTIPSGATSLRTSLELYPTSAAAPVRDLLVSWVVTRAGSADPVEEREAAPMDRAGVLRADAEFVIDVFEAGTYTVTATVRQGEVVLGTATRLVTRR